MVQLPLAASASLQDLKLATRGANLCERLGGQFAILPQFSLFSTLGGINLDHDFF